MDDELDVTRAEQLHEWVMVGSARAGGGVRILASRKLRPGGSVTPLTRMAGPLGGGQTYLPEGWKIDVRTNDVVTVDADTYAQAMGILMGIWARPDPEEPVAGIFR